MLKTMKKGQIMSTKVLASFFCGMLNAEIIEIPTKTFSILSLIFCFISLVYYLVRLYGLDLIKFISFPRNCISNKKFKKNESKKNLISFPFFYNGDFLGD